MIPNVLSIAGSDPSGGAGIQADLKAIAANGAYGMAALTALTAQNTQGVTEVELVSPDFVKAQITAVFDDVRVDAVKIGMIATAEIANAIAEVLEARGDVPVVLDPVMIAKGGAPLLQPDAMDTLRRRLVPRATIITPNLPEAAHLLDETAAATREEMAAQAHALTALGPQAALVKGGHLDSVDSPDALCVAGDVHWFDAPRTPGKNTHGTGCTLSSALAAQLAHGLALPDAVDAAKSYVAGAIAAAEALSVGHGHGPVHHYFDLWKDRK
ncbi:bifunctional hydroxymethylpyrimidine kinase/phosphomethylpyrimidine kinase [Tateyamaria omphalii]|uniref:bifunctional hydroxymethylpyrimidine kinase/phosphomethylpyrimidine kinase n=1 Tax=Tateyamaria omphalii TaxID=299262 RepID=UPI001C998821|nr:bifunctional hydroxymethylpyrimidine kinase/phosphomethylpyrimidine kinase [Tateyamaria omphalii]MBY5934730.1 bifunctional hydroxymethylpyrimidine kinase/phosphomethylpyrimidine kinase [Tateyamaria omphalii]